MQGFSYQDGLMREVFGKTQILRKPISGIISGYHELPYILIAPDEDNPVNTVEINGKISVSPKFIITPQVLGETFGEVFDPGTFSEDLQGRLFSFAFGRGKNMKVESEFFRLNNVQGDAQEHVRKVQDRLAQEENVRTGLILGPAFKYYPVSIDRFITEIMDREFRV